jgi:hypothetical protein
VRETITVQNTFQSLGLFTKNRNKDKFLNFTSEIVFDQKMTFLCGHLIGDRDYMDNIVKDLYSAILGHTQTHVHPCIHTYTHSNIHMHTHTHVNHFLIQVGEGCSIVYAVTTIHMYSLYILRLPPTGPL